ncbi:SMI1/KNR4 family protein [Kitasatospora cineracea]|uniref:SUKH superfamily protein n=1 Tax=Kitasatospora cineracea TaxID=88074 RepID=A0A8G1URZ8_9ACTN|nr:SMI1/KNR4 family protein [Kitasatospora cineracea]ROR46839.1 hypothetical protein EDD39_5130 [Kitasatospora cineracea]
MSEYVDRVFDTINPGRPDRPAVIDWRPVEDLLGANLPEDFKRIIETYGPAMINEHLMLFHPGTELFNLKDHVSSRIEALKSTDWGDITFRGAAPVGGGPDGLIPVISTDRNESAFLVRAETGEGWNVVGFAFDGEFTEFRVGFSEWLYRYLLGEDVFGPGTGMPRRGAVKIQDLPKTRGEGIVERRGPARAK